MNEKQTKPAQKAADSALEEALCRIAACYGEEVLKDGQRLLSLFSEQAPRLKREYRLLEYLVECDGAVKLLEASRQDASSLCACRETLVAEMQDELMITESAARTVCQAVQNAFLSGSKLDTAIRQLSQEANAGSADAQTKLGCLLFQQGTEYGERMAVAWFSLASDQGNLAATYNWGLCLMLGRGTKQDFEQARQKFYTAATHGYPPAQNMLGYCCEKEMGGRPTEAAAWYQKAARMDNPEGQLNYARCLAYGIGTEADLQQAWKWMNSARNNGMEIPQKLEERCSPQ